MISASELRIGNYALIAANVEQVTDVDYKETWVSANHISEIDKHELLCRGIKLNEEWLLKFGFEKELLDAGNFKEGYYFTLNFNNEKYFDLGFISGDKNGYMEVCLFPYEDYIRFRYVHHFQNLYHALTGEELTIHQPTQSL